MNHFDTLCSAVLLSKDAFQPHLSLHALLTGVRSLSSLLCIVHKLVSLLLHTCMRVWQHLATLRWPVKRVQTVLEVHVQNHSIEFSLVCVCVLRNCSDNLLYVFVQIIKFSETVYFSVRSSATAEYIQKKYCTNGLGKCLFLSYFLTKTFFFFF